MKLLLDLLLSPVLLDLIFHAVLFVKQKEAFWNTQSLTVSSWLMEWRATRSIKGHLSSLSSCFGVFLMVILWFDFDVPICGWWIIVWFADNLWESSVIWWHSMQMGDIWVLQITTVAPLHLPPRSAVQRPEHWTNMLVFPGSGQDSSSSVLDVLQLSYSPFRAQWAGRYSSLTCWRQTHG